MCIILIDWLNVTNLTQKMYSFRKVLKINLHLNEKFN